MIYFKTIRWKNLLSTGNVFTEIKLDRSPSTIIVGENGGGKSTILDALCFTLFGKPFRNIKKNQLLNTINGKDMVCEVEFNVGTTEYKIIRGITPNKFEIYKNDSMLNQHGSVRDYQEQLESTILKLNYKSFTQIVVLGNASFTPFMQLSTRDRREVIEDLLDIQIFSNMNMLLKDRVAENKQKYNDVVYQIDLLKEKIAVQKDYHKKLVSDTAKQIKEYKDEIREWEARMDASDKTVYDYRFEITSLQDVISNNKNAQKKVDKAKTLVSKLNSKIKNSQKRVDFFNEHDHCPTCDQNIDESIKNDKVTKSTKVIDETQSALEQLEVEYKKLLDNLMRVIDASSEINEINIKIREAVKDQENYRNNIVRLRVYIENISGDTGDKDAVLTEIERLNIAILTYNKSQEELSNQKDLYGYATQMLKDGGIKTKIIRQYVPIINKLVTKYLAAFDFFVNFELDEEFNEIIKSRHRDEFSYDSFSEGEKARIDLALLLTWRAVAKLKNSVNTNLLILDEIFDSSMDSNGVELLMGLFNELHDTNIFIISHRGDQLTDKFRSQIKFGKHKNFSRIV